MEPDNIPDTPAPKRKRKEKEASQVASQVTPQPPNATNDQLVELIKEVLSHQSKRQPQKRKTENEIEAMVSTCEEFMSSFIILGYDFSGNVIDPVVVAHSQQEADSLGAYLQKFINSQFQKPPS